MKRVVTLGEILVEIVADSSGQGFEEPLTLTGPFPSGAPAIFIDQVAKLGQPCGIIACVGDDDFGLLNRKRLARDGVNTDAVQVSTDAVTGSAFVRYREDGVRDFIFNLAASAAGQVRLTEVALRMLESCGHLHISGSSLISTRIVQLAERAVTIVKAHGGSVSFDPNVRGDIAQGSVVHRALQRLLGRCDIFMPSEREVVVLTGSANVQDAIGEILGLGVSYVVVKRGVAGSSLYRRGHEVTRRGYEVDEVDPTGAGDCYDATFVTCLLQGRSFEESVEYANAAGALAVCRRGPMEGTSTFAQLRSLRAGSRSLRSSSQPVPVQKGWKGLWTFVPAAEADGRLGTLRGITSVCSAHPLVIEAALQQAATDALPVLIEATCNQVNHEGGYTGLRPADFRDLVCETAERLSLPLSEVVLGGDHLGPSPWCHLPAVQAMRQAEAMVADYVSAGYVKIHMDTSMGCLGEPERVGDSVAAARAAQLVAVAEDAARGLGATLYYVIGAEVPTPGGALHKIINLEVTRPSVVLATVEAHRQAFEAAGVQGAFQRVIAVVAQPGVEFDELNVVLYDSRRAQELSEVLVALPGVVFEAHSTDYQPTARLAALVRDGFAILKVGPGLTFALREALYGLDHIALIVNPGWSESCLMNTMEQEMMARSEYWRSHYSGSHDQLRLLRHFSYSDRIRYYWESPAALGAVERLVAQLGNDAIPLPLISQFLPRLYDRVAEGQLLPLPKELVLAAVRDVLRRYAEATTSAIEQRLCTDS